MADDQPEPIAPTNDNPSLNTGAITYPSQPAVAPSASDDSSTPQSFMGPDATAPDTTRGVPKREQRTAQESEKEIPRETSSMGNFGGGDDEQGKALQGLSPGGHAPSGIDPSNPNLDDATRQRLQDFAEHKGAMDDAEFGKAYARSQGPTPSHRVLDTIANQVGPDQREAAIKAALKRADEANAIGRAAWDEQHGPRAAAWLTAANASVPNGWDMQYTATPDGKMVVEANHVANTDPRDPNGHKTWAIPNDRFAEIIHDPTHFSPHALMANQQAVFDMFDKAEGNQNVQAPNTNMGPTREQLLGQAPAPAPGQAHDPNVPAPQMANTPEQKARALDVAQDRYEKGDRPQAQQPRGSMENYQARNYMAHALNQQRLAEEGRLPNGQTDPIGRARAQIALDHKYNALTAQMERQYPVPQQPYSPGYSDIHAPPGTQYDKEGIPTSFNPPRLSRSGGDLSDNQAAINNGNPDEFGGLQPKMSKDMTEHDRANYLRQHPTGDYVQDSTGRMVPPTSAPGREAAWQSAANKVPNDLATGFMGAHLNANKQWTVTDADGREHTFADRKSAQAAEDNLMPTAREAIAIHNRAHPTEDLGRPQRTPPQPVSTGGGEQNPGMNVIRGGIATHYENQNGRMVPTSISGAGFGRPVRGGRGADQMSLENLKHQHRMEQINAQQGGRGASHGEAAKIQGQNALERGYMQAHPDEYVHDASGVHWKDPNAGKAPAGGSQPIVKYDQYGRAWTRDAAGRVVPAQGR